MSRARVNPSNSAPVSVLFATTGTPYHALSDEIKNYLTTLHISGSHWALLSIQSQHNHIAQFLNKVTKEYKPESPAKAATDIQRLWRGHQLRKNMALTFPSVLTYRTKFRLWSAPQKSPQDIESKLFAVHATDYFPMNGIIRVVDPKKRGGSYFRPTTHFALGELVRAQANGKISRENKKFAIITPLKDLTLQLLSLNFYDTYILGDFRLTHESIVLTPAEETKQFQSRYPNLKIVGYDSAKEGGLRHAIKSIVKEQGGYDIVSFENDEKRGPWAPVTFQSESNNLNTPEFLAKILQRQRGVAFGAHYTAIFGSAYLIGIVDNALTQLGFSPDYFDNVYNDDPPFTKILIEFALKKIESSPMAHQNYPGSGVLKLHVKYAREGLQKLAVSSDRKNFSSDYIKAQIARLLTWPDLYSLMQANRNLSLYDQSAFLCMYAFYRTSLIGEQASAQEGLTTVFSHNLALLTDVMHIQVMGTILAIRSNLTDKTIFPGGVSYLQQLLIRFGKAAKLTVIPSENLETIADRLWKTLHAQQRLWLPTQIDLLDATGNVPLIQAIIARDEQKALGLLSAGANILNVHGHVNGWSIRAPLLTIALRYGMSNFAKSLLQRPDYIAWDQSDGWQNTPLCDAIVMGLGDIAAQLIERGARVDRRPNYSGVQEQDLVSLASKMGLVHVVELLRERGRASQISMQAESARRCKIM